MKLWKKIALLAVASTWMLPLYVYGATSVTMDGPMTDSNAALGQAYNKNFTLNMDDKNIDVLAVQTTFSSATFAATKTFNDGRASTATLTVASFAALSTAAATGSITVVSTSSLPGVEASTSILITSNVTGTVLKITGPPANLPNQITVGGNVLAGGSAGALATNIGTFWSSATSAGFLRSVVSGASVTITFTSSGTFGNAYAITSSSQAAISSATFVGGINPATVTVAGAILRANGEWNVGADTNTTASNIAAAINLYIGTNSAVAQQVIATTMTTPSNIVYTTAAFNGSAGNALSLGSAMSSITVSGPFMTGGTDNAVLTINGIRLLANTTFYPITSNTVTAAAIVTAYNLIAGTSSVALGSAGVVVGATSTAVGTNTTFTVTTSSQGALTISPFTSSSTVNGAAGATGSMYGGLGSSMTLNSATIKIPAHGLPTGLPVWLSVSNITPAPLAANSTYYVLSVDANDIALALTSTGAAAGLGVPMTTSSAPVTTDTFTLNIATVQATGPSFGYWASNDGLTYTQVISTTSVAYVFPSTTTFNDVGTYDWKFFQLRVVAPITGAMPITSYVHGEKR